MDAPPPQGSVYEFIDPHSTDAEAWGVFLAWDAWRYLAGTVVPQAWAELAGLQTLVAR